MKLAQVQKLAFALQEVTEEPHFHRTSFRVRGKIFATVVANEPWLNLMVGDSVREPALHMYPDCVEKLHWGKKVVGLTVNLEKATQSMVAELLAQAWREKAPKSILHLQT